MSVRRKSAGPRTGSVAVELAVLLPLIMFMAVIGVDYARIFSRALILEAASRDGALYGAQDPTHSTDSAGIQAVATADMTDIEPLPTVSSKTYSGSDGTPYIQVTVKQTFTTVTDFPGVPSKSNLVRSTVMRVCPSAPKPGTYKNY